MAATTSFHSFTPLHPRLALVVGSGGVRGIAAAGIVARLAQAGLRPDLIVGCSSGAVFGGAIAVGMSPPEALSAATRMWSPELTRQKRWGAVPQLVAPRLAGFDAGFSLRDNRAIERTLIQAFGNQRLESLPIPMRVAATDAGTGQAVVLSRGRMAQAILASMAVPIMFPSVEIEGRRLVDGAISDPLPLHAALDADVIIALGIVGNMPRRVDRASRLVAQAGTALINNLMAARLEAVQARGHAVVQIELALAKPVGIWNTRAMPRLYEAGIDAADRQMPEILRLIEQAPLRAMCNAA